MSQATDRLVDDLVSAAVTVGSNVTMPYEVALACHLRLNELRERTKALLREGSEPKATPEGRGAEPAEPGPKDAP